MSVLGPTKPYIPIGVTDYAELRTAQYTYVDKTAFVAEVIGGGAQSLLVPRPRRFGKTLNMSTLRYFLERSPAHDRTGLFEDTYVWAAEGGRFRAHFQRYAVVSLSFKDLMSRTWDDCWAGLRGRIQRELTRVWNACGLGRPADEQGATAHLYAALRDPSARPADLADALPHVMGLLHETTGERVAILIDEYDAPILAAHQHGYFDEALGFFRAFYSAGLKDNPHLFRGVLTGILRVAKESIFSGLNNFRTLSILSDPMADAFGFTEPEVEALLAAAGRTHALPAVRQWYNGYSFGRGQRVTLYNPWSILNYLNEPISGPVAHWKNSSSNDLVRSQLRAQAAAVGPDVERLIRGETIDATLDENIAVRDLDRSPSVLWALLTFTGYLTPTSVTATERGLVCSLRIPNREVLSVFEDTFAQWLLDAAGPSGLGPLTAAILAGDAVTFEDALGHILERAASYHDFAGSDVEAVYHAFVVGLLVHMEPTHRVRSNRESGYGRADVLISPRAPGPGAVFELKRVRHRIDETPEAALEAAAAQLRTRDYAAEVRADGATAVHQYAVVFDGKRCWVRGVV